MFIFSAFFVEDLPLKILMTPKSCKFGLNDLISGRLVSNWAGIMKGNFFDFLSLLPLTEKFKSDFSRCFGMGSAIRFILL